MMIQCKRSAAGLKTFHYGSTFSIEIRRWTVSIISFCLTPPTHMDESCTVCKDVFHISGSKITKMPCGHFFDKDCIVPWLELHNTCPMCRAEVETEKKVKEEEEEEQQNWMYS
ncbi:hypothetical protein BC938DRAFT_477411 [Jimgerdemannia flammicorona]|uniref:RING-type domain-containing protein n=1 Tax=Jimgerdemannia flammicorona TaxID=994334 RepID=A0A433QYW3_9FUNG|nr:hypothetical protein BC938DRAFT_477411 [Jimgerdemannia flammicorona]